MPDESALIMPWGKFKGQPIEEVPNWYVRWLAENANVVGRNGEIIFDPHPDGGSLIEIHYWDFLVRTF